MSPDEDDAAVAKQLLREQRADLVLEVNDDQEPYEDIEYDMSRAYPNVYFLPTNRRPRPTFIPVEEAGLHCGCARVKVSYPISPRAWVLVILFALAIIGGTAAGLVFG